MGKFENKICDGNWFNWQLTVFDRRMPDLFLSDFLVNGRQEKINLIHLAG